MTDIAYDCHLKHYSNSLTTYCQRDHQKSTIFVRMMSIGQIYGKSLVKCHRAIHVSSYRIHRIFVPMSNFSDSILKSKTELYFPHSSISLHPLFYTIYLGTRASFHSFHFFRRTIPMHLLAFGREWFFRNMHHQLE